MQMNSSSLHKHPGTVSKVLQRVTYSCTVDHIVDLDLNEVARWAATTCLIRELFGNEPGPVAPEEMYWMLLKNSALRTEICSRYAKYHEISGASIFS